MSRRPWTSPSDSTKLIYLVMLATSVSLNFNARRGQDPSSTSVSLDFDARRRDDPSSIPISLNFNVRRAKTLPPPPFPSTSTQEGGTTLPPFLFPSISTPGGAKTLPPLSYPDFNARRRENSSTSVSLNFDAWREQDLLHIRSPQLGNATRRVGRVSAGNEPSCLDPITVLLLFLTLLY